MAKSLLTCRLASAVAAAVIGLAGCGGGIYIGWGGDDDDPPIVGLVSSLNAAAPGQTVTLMAAASDDFGIDRVQFFRIESDGSAVSLGSDSSAPYQHQTAMPNTSANAVRYFARAFDEGDQFNDSDPVTVTVLR